MVALSEFSTWDRFTSRADKKITKNQPAMRTSEPIKFHYSLQSNQSYLSKIKTLKIKAFLFQLPPTFFFSFKLNGQNKFILRSENTLKCRPGLRHLHGFTCLKRLYTKSFWLVEGQAIIYMTEIIAWHIL